MYTILCNPDIIDRIHATADTDIRDDLIRAWETLESLDGMGESDCKDDAEFLQLLNDCDTLRNALYAVTEQE